MRFTMSPNKRNIGIACDFYVITEAASYDFL